LVHLVIHPHPSLNGQLLELAAALPQVAEPPAAGAEQGCLLVLDGGNCFNVYQVARSLRQRTSDVTAALQRIRVARAFTCFEMATLLQRQEAAPGTAILVLDLLGNFRDENVPLKERQRLLHTCLPHLRRLAHFGPLLVSSRPADPCLTQALVEAADQVLELEAPPEPPVQMPLL
jgi:hypothetical protein